MREDRWELWDLAQRVEELEALADERDDCRQELLQLAGRLRRSTRAIDRRFARTQRWVRRCFVEMEALTGLLKEQGIVEDEALADRTQEILAGLVEDEYAHDGLGVTLDRKPEDKYAATEAEADCGTRWHVCHAICCYILSFSISRQDVLEGLVEWDAEWPYRIAREPDGKCVHLDRDRCQCALREHRPRICRIYDCRNDKRIWSDYDGMVLSHRAARDVARRFEGAALTSPEGEMEAVEEPMV